MLLGPIVMCIESVMLEKVEKYDILKTLFIIFANNTILLYIIIYCVCYQSKAGTLIHIPKPTLKLNNTVPLN